MEIKYTPAAKSACAPRGNHEIKYIVLHVMEGSMAGTLAEFAPEGSKKSAHYGISRKGEVVQYVFDDLTAYHAGNLFYNQHSLGIELEGFCIDPNAFTEAMMDALNQLLVTLMNRYDIPLSNVIGHCDVPDPSNPDLKGGLNHHTDPGPYFPWDSLRAKLDGKE